MRYDDDGRPVALDPPKPEHRVQREAPKPGVVEINYVRVLMSGGTVLTPLPGTVVGAGRFSRRESARGKRA